MEIRMDTTIEYDRKDNREAIRALWQSVFCDPAPFADYYFEWIYPKNQVIMAKQNDQLSSMLHLNPYHWAWNFGRQRGILKLHYIVGVATKPECRRQGLMQKCMERALQDLAAAGEPFTYLMPAKKEYYEPFQFVTITEERRWMQGAVDTRKQERKQDGQSFPVRSTSYMNQLRAEVQCEGGGLLEWNDGNSYCAYVLNREAEPPRIVIEQFFELEEGRAGGKCGSGWKAAMQTDVWQDRLVPELYRRYGDMRIEYIESQAMMLRILDVEQFAALLPYEGRPKRISVCLTDPICKKNNGSFQLVLSPEGCWISRREYKEEADFQESVRHWNIGELTAYLLQETRLGERLYVMEIV